MHPVLTSLLEERGVLLRTELGRLERQVRRSVAVGELVAVLPGVYAADRSVGSRILAVRAWDPDAVVHTDAAALVTFDPGRQVEVVAVSSRRQHRVAAPGMRFSRRVVPPEFVMAGFTTPALTAVELAGRDRGQAIDVVLRRGLVTLAELQAALLVTRRMPGHAERSRVVAASASNPWSQAERLAHQLLWESHVVGWEANALVEVAGASYFGDIVFRRARLVVEVDGWEVHGDRLAFERDRERQNRLQLAGWLVLRFTWRQLEADPSGFVRQVRAALARRGA